MAQAANPFVQVRVLTYLSLAQYNAIFAAENSKTPGPHPSAAGAAAGASVVVLKDFFPDQAESLEDPIAAQAGEKQAFAAGYKDPHSTDRTLGAIFHLACRQLPPALRPARRSA